MKVRELIEELQKLDQEKGIWVRYDSFDYFPPIPDETADEFDAENHADVKKGDYIIKAE